MGLIEQVEEKRKEIFTDSYPMSIGELANLYRDKELEINPAFQRFFRWTHTQKVRLIESILLGIPLPSIFVAQRDDGVWDLVDGLQRISTILSFMNMLQHDASVDGEESLEKPLILSGTDYLPLLEGVSWNGGEKELDDVLKRLFKREKIEVKIIKKESDTSTKFELFQRLNTGGSQLSDQEVRNCLLIMLNENFYATLLQISQDANFNSTISITERLYEERYEMELALRLLAITSASDDELKKIPDVSEFLTAKLKEFAEANIDWDVEKEIFSATFKAIYDALGENAFKRYDGGIYKGSFQLSIYELIATGSYLYVKSGLDRGALPSKIKEVSESLPNDDVFKQYSGSGSKANYRWPRFVPLAREMFLGESAV